MLETVKTTIYNSPCISFVEYFANYVMYVQDVSIEYELSSMIHNNRLNIHTINRLINEDLKRLSSNAK